MCLVESQIVMHAISSVVGFMPVSLNLIIMILYCSYPKYLLQPLDAFYNKFSSHSHFDQSIKLPARRSFNISYQEVLMRCWHCLDTKHSKFTDISLKAPNDHDSSLMFIDIIHFGISWLAFKIYVIP